MNPILSIKFSIKVCYAKALIVRSSVSDRFRRGASREIPKFLNFQRTNTTNILHLSLKFAPLLSPLDWKKRALAERIYVILNLN